jgi:hypothetical protein
MHLFNATIHFIPDSLAFNPIAVHLLTKIHHHMMPHPTEMEAEADLMAPDTLYIVCFIYLEDKDEIDTAQTVYFRGRKSDLDTLVLLASEAATAEQARQKYTPRSISDLPALPPQQPIGSDVSAPELLPVAVRKRVAMPIMDVDVIGGPSKIVGDDHIVEMRRRFPRRHQNGNWQLLYQLSTDGCSMQTMYDKVAHKWPVVIAVKTDRDDRIGAFLTSELKVSRGYYGQPDSFVWRIQETVEMFGGSGPPPNRYFVSCVPDQINIGGGPEPAILIGDRFESGISRECTTYASPPLTERERFGIVDVEIWAVSKDARRPSALGAV